MDEFGSESWPQWLLRELRSDIRDLDNKFDAEMEKVREEITTLKIRAGVWGGFAGLLAGLVGFLPFIIEHWFNKKS